jgi:hypothetical protein
LESENRPPVATATAAVVKKIVKSLRSYGPSSFASLTDAQGNYVQVAGGGITCMVERREALTAEHYRAFQMKGRKGCPDGTLLTFGGGTISLKSDEWLSSDQALEIFLAFLAEHEMPESISWREVDLKEK